MFNSLSNFLTPIMSIRMLFNSGLQVFWIVPFGCLGHFQFILYNLSTTYVLFFLSQWLLTCYGPNRCHVWGFPVWWLFSFLVFKMVVLDQLVVFAGLPLRPFGSCADSGLSVLPLVFQHLGILVLFLISFEAVVYSAMGYSAMASSAMGRFQLLALTYQVFLVLPVAHFVLHFLLLLFVV